MISARAMAEGDEGRYLRNQMAEALWSDVLLRVKKLGEGLNITETRAKIVELAEQLQATYIAYDEGLQADDVVLAGAIWRRFYQQKNVDLEHIELLVKYIRKNMRMLDSMSSEQFYDPKNIKWTSLKS
ncbi:hypothetical protein HHI36_012123 [Cryptolaemus montrouzieri]|uniref:Ubiquinol-cytochrome c chaperone domain-containing protein n=1 Tax=Cryptolaemus montrouzieri TaxID=559131 RepID=A0ABD2NDA4_9CUCU